MKIKLLPGIEYEDIDPYRVYEVISEYDLEYIVLDDESDENAILKGDCEIVDYNTKEEPVKDFKVGDRVKINSDNMDELVEWSLIHKVHSTGVVVEESRGDSCLVLIDGDSITLYVPNECLKIIEDDFTDYRVEKPTKSPDSISTLCNTSNENKGSFLQQILNFTRDMKGFEVSFEEGKVTVKDWNIDYDCVEYVLDSIDDLEPMMESISHIQSFKK